MDSDQETLHLVGTLHAGPIFLELRVDGGGVWQLDPTATALQLVGRRVEVLGTPIGFDDLHCHQIWPAGSPMPPARSRWLSPTVLGLCALAAVLIIAMLA